MSTYTPISSQTLSSSESSVTFNNMPQGYTDLVIIINSQRTANAGSPIRYRFNSDANSNYSQTNLYSNGSVASSDKLVSNTYIETYGVPTSPGISTQILNISNYSNTTTYKTMLARGNNTAQQVIQSVGMWRNTNAITSIEIYVPDQSMASGTTFNLYGIAAGSAKAQGGLVTTDGTYWYHTFTGSGLFQTNQTLTVDYLVIAGGAGGAAGQMNNSIGSGGGAGGLRSTVGTTGGGGSLESALSLDANTNYVVTVGAGGPANTIVPNVAGINGSNSIFSTITSIGGGGGDGPGKSGGSGGGGRLGTGNTGGAGTANQGYAGGNGGSVSGGGGGGAGGAGSSGSGTQGGTGGAGVSISAWATATNTGVSNSYAGGGGGATDSSGSQPSGGSGGGGFGSKKNAGNATAGTVNTGSGGGGGTAGNGANQFGGSGGSGLVILRYAV